LDYRLTETTRTNSNVLSYYIFSNVENISANAFRFMCNFPYYVGGVFVFSQRFFVGGGLFLKK